MAIEVADLLETQFANEHLHDAFVHLQLAVLELALQCFLGKESLLDLRLLQRKTNFRLSA